LISYELITDAAYRLEEISVLVIFQLVSQPTHVDVQEICVYVIVRRPNLLYNIGSRQDSTGTLHEYFQERVFSAREIDLPAIAVNGMTEKVEANAIVLEHRELDRRLTPQERANMRK
jgi:hypothetical protein